MTLKPALSRCLDDRVLQHEPELTQSPGCISKIVRAGASVDTWIAYIGVDDKAHYFISYFN